MKNKLLKTVLKYALFSTLALTMSVTAYAGEIVEIGEIKDFDGQVSESVVDIADDNLVEEDGILDESAYEVSTDSESLFEDVNGVQIMSENGSLDFADAPSLNLGQTYTFDYNAKYQADLTTGEKYKNYYFKYVVPNDGFYNVKFKSMSYDEADIHLVDNSGKKVAGDSYLANEAYVKNDISLSAGTYYISIYDRGEYAHGWIYFGERSQKMEDPEYLEDQEIKHNTETGIITKQDMYSAPRFEIGDSYTFDFKSKNQANFRVDERYKNFYIKYIVKTEGFYNLRIKSMAAEETDIHLVNSNGGTIAGDSYLGNEAYVKNDIPLTPGVYFLKVYARSEDSFGWICLSERGKKVTDVEYNLSQEIKSNSAQGTVLTRDMGFAPRINLGDEYTFDYRLKYNANLRIDNTHKNYFAKLIIEDEGVYGVTYSSTTNEESDIYLVDRNGKKVAGDSYLGNEAYTKKEITLTPGVYYVCLYLRNENSRGSVVTKLVKKVSGNNDEGGDKPSPDPQNPDDPSVGSETVSVNNGNDIVVKQKIDLSSYFAGINGKVKYSVAPKGVGSVKNGVFTAKKACGDPIVIKAIVDGKTKKQITFKESIVKPVAVKGIVKNKKGETISANELFSTTFPKVSRWESSKTAVATVDPTTGTVTIAEKSGSTKITAYFGEGNNAAKYTITIKTKLPTLVPLKLKVNGGKQMKIKNAYGTPTKWTSSNTKVAEVDASGWVSAKAVGTAKITAIIDGVEYYGEVTVK